MKELLKRSESEVKYQEDILNTDFIGVLSEIEGRIILVKDEYGKFIGMSKNDVTNIKKWSEDTKANYVKNFRKVFQFDSEAEMMLWYNGK